MKVALFLEDAAHLAFIGTLLRRVASNEGIDIEVEERNAVGGSGQVMTSLRSYVTDLAKGRAEYADVLVVAIDGNCHGVNERVGSIRATAEQAEFAGQLACAVPDPHVEIWYLADGRAAAVVAGSDTGQPALPQYKCEPGRYKALLEQVFLQSGQSPPLGGSEFGEEIATELDLEAACRAQDSLGRFVDELRAALKQLRASGIH
jgi:hypothetical protein